MATTILFADDDPFHAQLVLHALRSKGYEVDHVDDGAKALAAVEKKSYDLIISMCLCPSSMAFKRWNN